MADRTRTGQFKKGQSGNPAGTASGSRHRVTVAAEALIEGEAEAITRKLIEQAKAGDPQALRLTIERLVPVRKDRRIAINIRKIGTDADRPAALAEIVETVASGEISPAEGQALALIIEAHRRSVETDELVQRLRAVEERLGDGSAL